MDSTKLYIQICFQNKYESICTIGVYWKFTSVKGERGETVIVCDQLTF